jgi:hypothetical protein
MLRELEMLVATTRKDIRYLLPLTQHGRRSGGLTIATLNYDLSIEYACDEVGVNASTGIGGWVSQGRVKFENEGVHLLKLHGSINWSWTQSGQEEGRFPRRTIHVGENRSDDRRSEPAVIFGQRDKLTAEGPFLGLLAEFETRLASSTRLVAIGYSFRDQHVNELIRRWAAEDSDRTILVVDPYWPERFAASHDDFRGELNRFLVPPDWKDPPPFEPRIEIWREPCSLAVRQLA